MVYVPNAWNVGDVITALLMNNLETQYLEFTKLYDAQSILIAIVNDTPIVQAVAANRIVGRAAGNVGVLTGTQVRTIIGWTNAKLLLGAGAGIIPTEIDIADTTGIAIYGDGSDGNITVNANPFTSGTLIVNNELKRDAFFDNLTVENTRILITNGYRIFVKGTLTNAGTIRNNGSDAVGLVGGSGGGGGTVRGGGAGGNAPVASDNAGSGGGGGGIVFIAAKVIDNSIGVIESNGGDGSNAGAETGANANGIAGASITSSLGGNGGAGGTANGGATPGGGGGTATATKGGHRSTLLGGFDPSVPQALGGGGSGGGGGCRAADGSAGGGGGGGGGGIMIIYNSTTWGTEQALLGTGGTGFGGDGAGVNGVAGTVIKISNL